MPRILGVDGGFANIGWAVSDPSRASLDLGVIMTEKSDKKRAVGAPDDVVRRAREIDAAFWELGARFRPAAITLEAFSKGPPNVVTQTRAAVTLGVIVALACRLRIPIIQSSPAELKKRSAGAKNASKDDVETALRALYVPASWPLGEPKLSAQHHAWDALASIEGARASEIFVMIGADRT